MLPKSNWGRCPQIQQNRQTPMRLGGSLHSRDKFHLATGGLHDGGGSLGAQQQVGSHCAFDAEVSGVRCIGLNKVAMPGNLVAIEMEPGKRDWSLLGEYTQR